MPLPYLIEAYCFDCDEMFNPDTTEQTPEHGECGGSNTEYRGFWFLKMNEEHNQPGLVWKNGKKRKKQKK